MPNNLVSTLGTLHGLFLSNPNYGLKEFTSALYQFKPDLILSEVLPENANAADASIDGGVEQSIVYAYAAENAIPVIATDWFNEALIVEMEEENSKVTDELLETLQDMSEFRESFETASLLELHAGSTQNLVRAIYEVFEQNGLLASRKRNDRIVANIKKELSQVQGKRVLVIYGMDHKFFIDDHLQNVDSVEVVRVATWFKADIAKSFKISADLKKAILTNIESSKALLEKRIQSNHYPPELGEKLQAKLPQFDKWAAGVTKM